MGQKIWNACNKKCRQFNHRYEIKILRLLRLKIHMLRITKDIKNISTIIIKCRYHWGIPFDRWYDIHYVTCINTNTYGYIYIYTLRILHFMPNHQQHVIKQQIKWTVHFIGVRCVFSSITIHEILIPEVTRCKKQSYRRWMQLILVSS